MANVAACAAQFCMGAEPPAPVIMSDAACLAAFVSSVVAHAASAVVIV